MMCLGHANGTVTMWTPNITTPVVKLLTHRGPVRALAGALPLPWPPEALCQIALADVVLLCGTSNGQHRLFWCQPAKALFGCGSERDRGRVRARGNVRQVGKAQGVHLNAPSPPWERVELAGGFHKGWFHSFSGETCRSPRAASGPKARRLPETY